MSKFRSGWNEHCCFISKKFLLSQRSWRYEYLLQHSVVQRPPLLDRPALPMNRGGPLRRPVGHPERCKARDKKLLAREELTGMETARQWCPCRLCCRTTQLLHSTVISHLRRFGRHPRCRATMWVSSHERESVCWIRQLLCVVCKTVG